MRGVVELVESELENEPERQNLDASFAPPALYPFRVLCFVQAA